MTLPTSWVAFNSDGSSMSITNKTVARQQQLKCHAVVVDTDMLWCIHTLQKNH